MACDAAGNLYVGRMDFSPSTSARYMHSLSCAVSRSCMADMIACDSGSVAVLSSSGALLQETPCPGSEISGVVVAGCVPLLYRVTAFVLTCARLSARMHSQ